MILLHSTRSWRPSASRSGKPRPGQIRRVCLLITCSANSHWAAISVAHQATNVGLNQAATPLTQCTRPRAHGHSTSSTRRATRSPDRSSMARAPSTHPASVVAQPASHAAAIARSDREPLCTQYERPCRERVRVRSPFSGAPARNEAAPFARVSSVRAPGQLPSGAGPTQTHTTTRGHCRREL